MNKDRLLAVLALIFVIGFYLLDPKSVPISGIVLLLIGWAVALWALISGLLQWPARKFWRSVLAGLTAIVCACAFGSVILLSRSDPPPIKLPPVLLDCGSLTRPLVEWPAIIPLMEIGQSPSDALVEYTRPDLKAMGLASIIKDPVFKCKISNYSDSPLRNLSSNFRFTLWEKVTDPTDPAAIIEGRQIGNYTREVDIPLLASRASYSFFIYNRTDYFAHVEVPGYVEVELRGLLQRVPLEGHSPTKVLQLE
jgi:hypothetical protein